MKDKPENQIEADTQPAYDPPQALRLGDIHAGTGGTTCSPSGSGASPCQTGGGAVGECEDGNSANFCTLAGNSPAN